MDFDIVDVYGWRNLANEREWPEKYRYLLRGYLADPKLTHVNGNSTQYASPVFYIGYRGKFVTRGSRYTWNELVLPTLRRLVVET